MRLLTDHRPIWLQLRPKDHPSLDVAWRRGFRAVRRFRLHERNGEKA